MKTKKLFRFLTSLLLLGLLGCTVVVENKSYSDEEVFDIAVSYIEIEKQYEIDQFYYPLNFLEEDDLIKHYTMASYARPNFALIKSKDNKYYLIEYIGSNNKNIRLKDMYNIMEISLPVSPDYYEVLYKDLTQENKEFVNSYLGKELYIDLRNSNESTIRLAKNNRIYIDMNEYGFYLYEDDILLFISNFNDAKRVFITQENVYDYFDIEVSFGKAYGRNEYYEYINFEFKAKDRVMVLFSRITFNFNIIVKTDSVSSVFIDNLEHKSGVYGTGFTSHTVTYSLNENDYFYSDFVTIEVKDITNINTLVYFIG